MAGCGDGRPAAGAASGPAGSKRGACGRCAGRAWLQRVAVTAGHRRSARCCRSRSPPPPSSTSTRQCTRERRGRRGGTRPTGCGRSAGCPPVDEQGWPGRAGDDPQLPDARRAPAAAAPAGRSRPPDPPAFAASARPRPDIPSTPRPSRHGGVAVAAFLASASGRWRPAGGRAPAGARGGSGSSVSTLASTATGPRTAAVRQHS